MAGKTRLINHNEKAAVIIPKTLSEINPKKNTDTEPLTPISVSAIEGITDILKNVNELIIIESKKEISRPVYFNSIKN